jgi:uncharacterized phosphatase
MEDVGFDSKTGSGMFALVRHGETDWNLERRLQGRTDNPLNETGRGHARQAADELRAEAWDGILSSPLLRAVQTARIIAEELDVPYLGTVDQLIERDFGRDEGRVVPAGERLPLDDAEPEAEVARRGIEALADLSTQYEGRRVIVVAHGTLIRLTLTELLGRPVEHILNGQVIRHEPVAAVVQ